MCSSLKFKLTQKNVLFYKVYKIVNINTMIIKLLDNSHRLGYRYCY